jgi:hypothetical protein
LRPQFFLLVGVSLRHDAGTGTCNLLLSGRTDWAIFLGREGIVLPHESVKLCLNLQGVAIPLRGNL